MQGSKMKQDYTKAREYYERTAKLDNSDALINLGNIYRNGFEVTRNFEKVRECYEKAIKLNNSYAMVNIGSLYPQGLGVKKDYEKDRGYETENIMKKDRNLMIQMHLYA